MNRMKTFFKYFLIIVIVYILSNIISYMLLKANYKNISCEVDAVTPTTIEITKSKASLVNGYAEGKITNNTSENINNKYLKFDCYTKRNVNVGTKYVEINNLASGEIQDFQIKYNYNQVDHIITSIVDKKDVSDTKLLDFSLDDFTKDPNNKFVWLAALLLIWG